MWRGRGNSMTEIIIAHIKLTLAMFLLLVLAAYLGHRVLCKFKKINFRKSLKRGRKRNYDNWIS